MVDKVKSIVAGLVVLAGIVAFYYFGDKLMIARVGMVLGGLAVGGLLFMTTEWGHQFKAYSQESVEEVR